ncbi:MAG: HEAT repeat domain-containing protein [Desulfobacterales bacterium]
MRSISHNSEAILCNVEANTADFLDVTETAVQGRLQRARAKIRRELKMVKDTFQGQGLSEDFSEEIKRLIERMVSKEESSSESVERLAEIGGPAVDPLCNALEDSRGAVREAAAGVLCRIGDERALHPLLRFLYADDGSASYRIFSRGKVLAIPGLQEELIKIIQSGKPVEKAWILIALSYAADDKKVYDCIVEAFEQHPEVRHQVLMGIMLNKTASLPFFLLKALETQDRNVMAHAVWIALSKGIQIPIEPALKAFSGKLSPRARIDAGNLVLNHRKKGIKALEQMMHTGSTAERSTAAVVLAQTGYEKATAVLKQDLNTIQKDHEWTAAIADALIRYCNEDLLLQIQDGQYPQENHHAIIWGITRSHIPQSEAVLDGFLHEGTPAVRRAALRMLVRQKGAEMLPELRQCLQKGRPRKLAQEAFQQMYRLGDDALSTVQEMFTSESWPERKAAVSLLRRWGKLLPAQIEQARSDPHMAVRQAAG